MANQNMKEIFVKIVIGVQEFSASDKYINFLKFSKLFHHYSFNNQILIYMQNKEATQVAGFKTWQKMNRNVKKNEKGIQIFYPIKVAPKNTNNLTEDEVKNKTFFTYRPTYIFDISQTDGEDLPTIDTDLNSDNMSELYTNLCNFSKYPIRYINETSNLKGYWNKTLKYIAIQESLSIDDKAATLLHELTHAIYDDFDYKKDRKLSEIFVESVAFIVADYFNLDTSNCSFEYITSWSKGNTDLIIDLGSKIQTVANDFICELEEFNLQKKVA